MTKQTVDPKATCRVQLEFDGKGNPTFSSTRSPSSFRQHALCVCPPHTVIPVVFLPGIMGTNLRLKKNGQEAWSPPNGKLAGLGEVVDRVNQKPAERQLQMSPDVTEVNPHGPCSLPKNFPTLTEAEAKKRGWGTLHADSYHGFLCQLEINLNEQFSKPGFSAENGNHLLLELGLLSRLGACGGAPAPAGAPDYQKAADEAAKAWGFAPEPLSEQELLRLDDYYYPVWAHGYNWLQSNEDAAQALLKKIDEIIAFYNGGDYFHCAGKVILVTHSMGGLVGRRAAQLAPDKILGVVHGVMPVAGAPVVYRRFRAGTETGGPFDLEGSAVAAIIGWDAGDITPVMACAPGPLELLPTKHYPAGWLKVMQGSGKEARQVIAVPQSDPYEEIYGKTTDDCWWGMIDPALIDPAGKIRSSSEPIEAYKDALKAAKKFHTTLDLYAHPQTYGYYGIDDKQHRAFGHIQWQAKDAPANIDLITLLLNQDDEHTALSKSTVSTADQPRVKLKLGNDKDQAGDGTVPLNSAKVLEQLQPAPKTVFPISGFDHQMSYANKYAIQATVYSVAKLVQLAEPALP